MQEAMRKRDVKVLGEKSKEMLSAVSRKGMDEITMLDC